MPKTMVMIMLVRVFFFLILRGPIFKILNPSIENHAPTQNKTVNIGAGDIFTQTRFSQVVILKYTPT